MTGQIEINVTGYPYVLLSGDVGQESVMSASRGYIHVTGYPYVLLSGDVGQEVTGYPYVLLSGDVGQE